MGRVLTPSGNKVLIVSLDNLGDLVFASALVPAVKALWPQAFLGLWCKEYTAEISQLIPGLNRTHAADPFWDKSPGRGKGPLLSFLKSWREVREEGYGTALVVSQASWAAFAVSMAGIVRRVGLGRGGNRRWLTDALAPENKDKPVLQEISRLLQPFGGSPFPLSYGLNGAALADRKEILAKITSGKPLACLHPFAGDLRRCVALSQWIALARTLEERGLTPFWLGTPAELRGLKPAAAQHPGWHYLDEGSPASLLDMAAASASAKVFIGHDSGPLHLAAALGVSCLGIYAPGEPLRTFPQGRAPFSLLIRPNPEAITAETMLAQLEQLEQLGSDTGSDPVSDPNSI